MHRSALSVPFTQLKQTKILLQKPKLYSLGIKKNPKCCDTWKSNRFISRWLSMVYNPQREKWTWRVSTIIHKHSLWGVCPCHPRCASHLIPMPLSASCKAGEPNQVGARRRVKHIWKAGPKPGQHGRSQAERGRRVNFIPSRGQGWGAPSFPLWGPCNGTPGAHLRYNPGGPCQHRRGARGRSASSYSRWLKSETSSCGTGASVGPTLPALTEGCYVAGSVLRTWPHILTVWTEKG